MPSVLTGKPHKIDSFEELKVGELTIFIDKNFFYDKPLYLDIRNFLFMKEIYIANWTFLK